MTNIDVATRTWIIPLGIHKQIFYGPYQRSKAGVRLFHWIYTIHGSNVPSTQMGQPDCNQPHPPWYKIIRLVNLHIMILCLSLVNARSVVNKVESLQQHILEREVDMCAIMETWIKSSDENNVTNEISPPGYSIYSHLRQSGRWGWGSALIYKDNVKVEDKTVDKIFNTLEHCNFTLKFAGTTVNLNIIHRIPSTSVIQFCDEMTHIRRWN